MLVCIPVLGGSWDLDLSGITIPAPVPNFMAFGAATAPTPLDVLLPTLFGAGCTGYMDLGFGLFGISPATAGVASVSVPIPSSPSLRGYTLTAQGLSINPATGKLGVSNGETGVLGH